MRTLLTDDKRPSDGSPAAEWESRAVERPLDELFLFARQYRSNQAYCQLLQFVTRLRTYSPFNAMLAHLQLPGAGPDRARTAAAGQGGRCCALIRTPRSCAVHGSEGGGGRT
jgi:hypothetical protein